MSNRSLPLFKIKPVALAVAMVIAQPAAALDWNLADRPLVGGNGVPPNLLFVVDDSGSMDWEIMSRDMAHDGLFSGPQPDGTSFSGDGGIKNRAGCTVSSGTFYGYAYGVEFKSNKYSNQCDVADDLEWRFRTRGFNPFYFDPTKEYKPWAGVDDKGNAFGNVSINTAWDNVFYKNYSGSGEWIDLATKGALKNSSSAGDNHVSQTGGFRFYTWKDDGDGKFENGEETGYSIGTPGTVQSGWFGNSWADVQTNFANWFSYYRGRELVAKAAFGRVVSTVSGAYMGLMTLHNNAGVNTPLALIDDSPDGQVNRANLMRSIYRIDSNNGTPLQNAMRSAGEYLSNQPPGNGLPQKSPLPAAKGGECQQNFMVAMTDGFYNGSYNDGGINNADGDKNSKFDGGAYADKFSKTLGDIAMHYYERDIDPTNANRVPTITGIDENNAQHVVTYTIAFGVDGTLKSMPSDPTKAFTWPDPTSSDAARVDDLRHAAYNGRGEFLAAQNPDQLVNSLNYMISRIQSRWGSASSVSFNTDSIRSDSVLFQAGYHTADWHGKLDYIPLNANGSLGTSIVEVGAKLETMKPEDRVIATIDPDGKKSIPFVWKANLENSATWKSALDSNTYLVDYLRGAHTCEEVVATTTNCGTNAFRNRSFDKKSWRLGDIVNSGPAYVKEPNAHYTFDDYQKFFDDNKGRTPMVYIGSNDGMLHGFDASLSGAGAATASTGNERLAFVPSALAPKLKLQSDPLYIHTYMVDGTPTVADARIGNNWRTVLVGGLRGGGQSVYALDVTNPAAFTAETVALWEFTDKDDADLGYTYSRPMVAKTATGKFAAIFGNGYNSTAADGNPGSGNAALYVVNMDSTIGAKTFIKLDTGVGPSSDPEGKGRPNGLSDVAVIDVDNDSVADFVYAGDLFGNMWRFDLTSADSTQWNVSYGGKPLFTAKSPDGKMQSITSRPTVARSPVDPGYMVYFGTGKYLEQSDNTSTGQVTQSFYAVRDKWVKGSSESFVSFARGNLLAQQIVDQTADYRITSNAEVDWAKHQGWYIDLAYKGVNDGERIISEPVLRNGLVMFTTITPGSGTCDATGSGWLMVLDIASGSRLEVSPFDINGDGLFSAADEATPTGQSSDSATMLSGLKFDTGMPSAPAVIDEGGLVDRIAIGTSGGALEYPGTTNSASSTSTLAPLNKLGVQGRLSWERIK